MIILKSERELNYLRDAGRIVPEAYQAVKNAVKPGVTTLDLDKIAEEYIKGRDVIPSFKGFHGFAGNICASVNEEVVHGIPGLGKLKTGDNGSIVYDNPGCGPRLKVGITLAMEPMINLGTYEVKTLDDVGRL